MLPKKLDAAPLRFAGLHAHRHQAHIAAQNTALVGIVGHKLLADEFLDTVQKCDGLNGLRLTAYVLEVAEFKKPTRKSQTQKGCSCLYICISDQ